MRLAWTLAAVVSLTALPARADKRLDQAVAKAEAQLAKGKEAEAVKILEKEVSRAKSDPEPPLALATMLLRLGRLDEASAALHAAGERAEKAPPAVRARGSSSFPSPKRRASRLLRGEAPSFPRTSAWPRPWPDSSDFRPSGRRPRWPGPSPISARSGFGA